MSQEFWNVFVTVGWIRNKHVKRRISNTRLPAEITVLFFVIDFWKTKLLQVNFHRTIAKVGIVDG